MQPRSESTGVLERADLFEELWWSSGQTREGACNSGISGELLKEERRGRRSGKQLYPGLI